MTVNKITTLPDSEGVSASLRLRFSNMYLWLFLDLAIVGPLGQVLVFS